jgi:AraC-like DNA-binding protein
MRNPTTAPEKRRGRRPAGQSRIIAPPYKGNEKPAKRTWDAQGGWLRVPIDPFEALLREKRLADFHQALFVWYVMKGQWGIPGEPVRDWAEPHTDEEWAERIGCSVRHFQRVKLDALHRGLVEARRDGRSLRFSARIENWAKAEAAPDLHSYDEDRIAANNAPVGHYSDNPSELEPGSTIAIPVFSCRRLSNGLDQTLHVRAKAGTLEIAGAKPAAASKSGVLATDSSAPAVRIASERAAKFTEASARRAIANHPDLADQVEKVLVPYFVQRQFVVDGKLKQAIAGAITQAGGTIEQFENFIRTKLTGEYPWRPGLFLASGGFMDEFREFVRQSRSVSTNGAPLSHPTGRKKTFSEVLEAGARLAREGA